ncbi:F-box protein SKIP14 [Ananas comosus]|uniref:F-box protein SKIP14 n=1 Tax=Ananas comosus TaxID=4615 RepID=A0A199UYG0_ANACO|nr:F-box protein SKIP14 [Ananas comosus]
MPLNSSLSMSFGGVDDFVDLVELLPSDPFEMNPENAFDPAVNYRVGDAVVEDNSLDGSGCYCNAAFESQIGYRGGCEAENGATSAEVGVPHEGLFYALGKLGVKDLLSVERVCKSLYYAVRNDPLLWRCIHVDLDFNRKIPDDAFFALTQRAQGSLRCLSMPGCVGITDDGLKRVLAANPRLSKLNLLECTGLTTPGLISNLTAFKSSGSSGIKHLRLGRLFRISKEQFEQIKLLLGVNQLQKPNAKKKLWFFHIDRFSLDCGDDRQLDVEMCPKCYRCRLVYDCPRESCRGGSDLCRACESCIKRCVKCGKCIKDGDYWDETFFFDYICCDCADLPHNAEEVVEEE